MVYPVKHAMHGTAIKAHAFFWDSPSMHYAADKLGNDVSHIIVNKVCKKGDHRITQIT